MQIKIEFMNKNATFSGKGELKDLQKVVGKHRAMKCNIYSIVGEECRERIFYYAQN